MKFKKAIELLFLDFPEGELHRILPMNNINLYKFELTDAEELLLVEGLTNGLIDLPPKSKIKGDSIVRSEILEWALTLREDYQYIFRKGKLKISNAHILTFEQYEDLLRAKAPSFHSNLFVLDLSFKTISPNLEFDNCSFYGGVNFERTKFRNLKFINSKIGIGKKCFYFFNKEGYYPSIHGEGAFFSGDFEILGNSDPYITDIDGVFNISSGIHFSNSVFKGNITFKYENFKEVIDFSFSKIEILNMSWTGLVESRLVLSYANIRSIYIFRSTFLAGDVDYDLYPEEGNDWSDCDVISAKGLSSSLFRINGECLILGKVLLNDSKINDVLRIEDTILISGKTLGIHEDDTTISASNSIQSKVLLRKGVYSFGQIQMSNSGFKDLSIYSACLFNYDTREKIFSTCLNLSNSNLENDLVFNSSQIEDISPSFNNIQTINSIINKYLNTFRKFLKEDSDKILKNPSNQPSKSQLVLNSEEVEGKDINHRLKELLKKIITTINIDDGNLIEKDSKSIEIEETSTVRSYLIWIKKRFLNTTLEDDHEKAELEHVCMYLIGETNLTSMNIGNKLDLAGALFYLPNRGKDDKNAIDLKFSTIGSSLFINDYQKEEHIPSFKSVGKVDLQSVHTNRFYVKPELGTSNETTWKIIGLKYNFIHTHDSNNKGLSDCYWFETESSKLNNRQPYEQLAFAYNNVGNDSEAKKILIRGRIKTYGNPVDLVAFFVIGMVARLTIPAWKSFGLLVLSFVFGILFYNYMGEINGFTLLSPNSKSEIYSPLWFTLENMIPIPLGRNHNLELSNKSFEYFKLLSPKDIGIFHKIVSTFFLTTFIIGIARITKKEN